MTQSLPTVSSQAGLQQPGYYGEFGGRFVAETLVPALEELEGAYREVVLGSAFQAEWRTLLEHYVGRPTPLTRADRLARALDPEGRLLGELWLKREDLCHTGAHKINNALGQVLLAKKLGKTRIIAETGAGQHGVATATAAAVMGLPCEVYMGAVDVERQAPNVARMRMLGARVIAVQSGSRTLKDAMNEALRDWVTNVRTTHYCVGSAAGPHPYPELVKELQRVIGDEAKEQLLARSGRLPDAVVACVGGGSNAIGMFAAFLPEKVRLFGVEAAGDGIASGRHAAPLNAGTVGVLHGSRTLVLADEDGQILEAHSISAGLDYPGVGPEHAALKTSGRAEYVAATDQEALDAAFLVARTEGIIVALETAHAFAAVRQIAERVSAETGNPARLALCLSGRGDKDLATLRAHQQESEEPSR
jgi:tryptophan synthase beta chain